MNTAQFLLEWAIRSSILIAGGALLLRILRVKDPSIRLAAWTAILCGSLAIPALTTRIPTLPVTVLPGSQPQTQIATHVAASSPVAVTQEAPVPRPLDWRRIVTTLYAIVSAILLLRVFVGLFLTRRLRRHSRATGLTRDGVEILESDQIAAPVTIGIARSSIVLPTDWREWDNARLDAVLAHEMSHVRRRDPAIQLLSSIHRALLWHSPLSWFLHRRLVHLAEEASDDAAIAATRDRVSYAEALLDFMQRGVRRADRYGVAMARYGHPHQRIHRILDSTTLSAGLTARSVAGIIILAAPFVYFTAAAQPSRPSQPTAPPKQPSSAATAAQATVAGPRESSKILRYRVYNGNMQMGSWDSSDHADDETLRARFGDRFLWFRQGSNQWVVTDSGVMDEIDRALEPQKKVNLMQDEVNKLQSGVNSMQDKVNAQQNDVNRLQNDVNSKQNEMNRLQDAVNRRQDLLNRVQAAQAENNEAVIRKLEAAIRELRDMKGEGDQDAVNRRQNDVNAAQNRVNQAQNAVNEAQNRVNAEQQKVNEQQNKVNAEQRRVNAQINARLQEIFDSVLKRGTVAIRVN